MYLEVDLDRPRAAVRLREAGDCQRLKCVVTGPRDAARLAEALGDIGRPEGHEAVFLQPDALRRLAAGQVSPGWGDSFQRMLDYARSKGWLNDAGEVRAHCEWIQAARPEAGGRS
jgi:hypothetical protein